MENLLLLVTFYLYTWTSVLFSCSDHETWVPLLVRAHQPQFQIAFLYGKILHEICFSKSFLSHKHLIKFTNEILGWDGSLVLGSVIFIVLFGIPNFCEASYIFFIQINKFPHTEGRTVSCGSRGMFFLPCPICVFIHLCVMARKCFFGLGYCKFVKTCPIWEEKENGDKSEYFFVYIRMIGCPFSFLSC